MKNPLQPLDRAFNRLFSSPFNPLYRSGTIAVGLLCVALVTGLYLCFFYRLGEPYESVLAIQNNVWLGRWVRSLHRYASDAMIVAVFFHILRMMIQGKTWGPRTLAWVSGVFLLVFLMVSGWTGFVLVWDTQGQTVAVLGANIMDSLGLFADPVRRSFAGQAPPPASFFFLNLFLHIVIPLALIFGLWLHTSRMANAVWLPHKTLMKAMCALLILVSCVWPAPLADKANLLQIPSPIPTDWYYNFWLPGAEAAPLLTFFLFLGGVFALALIPWLVKPRKEKAPAKSFNEQSKCQGCSQCVQDCPYEAIRMVPRTLGEGSPEVAQVNPDLCVSCGLCAGSCAPFTMGPAGRKASDQFTAARQFLGTLRSGAINTKERILVVGCDLQSGILAPLRGFSGKEQAFSFYPVPCAGTLHAAVMEYFASNFAAVAIVSCPERNCMNKDGPRLLQERIQGQREPTLAREGNRERIRLYAAGPGEEAELFRKLRSLQKREEHIERSGWLAGIAAGVAGVALLVAMSALTRVTYGKNAEEAYLRLSLRLSGQSTKTCRARTDAELASLPQHMRTPEICEHKMLSYRLHLTVDGRKKMNQLLRPGGLHADRPIYFERDLALPAGSHRIEMALSPEEGDHSGIALSLERELEIRRGRVALIHLSPDQRTLMVKEEMP